MGPDVAVCGFVVTSLANTRSVEVPKINQKKAIIKNIQLFHPIPCYLVELESFSSLVEF